MATQLRNDPHRGPSYEDDFAAWAFYQAMLVRAGRFPLIDRYWLAEELDTLGRGEFAKLRSALTRVLQHMLQWDHQPTRRTRSWVASIINHRKIVIGQLEENPSLKPRRDEAVELAYGDAVVEALGETRLSPTVFPQKCPYSWPEIVERAFDWPEEPGE